MKAITAAALPAMLLGCVVKVSGPVAHAPPPGHVQHSVWDEDEVHYVIFREYFGCSDRDVWRLTVYRRLYSLDAADLFFLMFVARHASVSFEAAFDAWWNACLRDHHRLVLLYRLSPTIFFVPIPANVTCPPPYGRAYGYWRNRTLGAATLSAEDYRGLIVMKVACDYYGHAPGRFFERVRAVGAPINVVYADHSNAGRGGKDARGQSVAAHAPRPWEMDKGRRDAWKRQAEEGSRKEKEEFEKRGGGPGKGPGGGPPDDDRGKGRGRDR